MTKSTITRERLQEIAEDGFLKHGESKELARMALTAMDSEPWCLPLDYLQGHKDGLEWASQLAEANHPETGDWLYDDPIELAKAIRKGPDMPPVQPVADSEPDRNPVLAYADSYRDMAKQGVESVPIWSVITDLERNIAPLYRHAQPALVIPDEMTAEQAYEIGYYYGEPVNVFARGANWMRQHIIDSTLAAAPQLPGSEPANVPGKWIPVSEQKPDCWCLTCRPVTLNDMRFVVCPDCGNKRCPRANDHRNACTRSNEPGQEGSAYPAAPQEVRGE
ncbi:DUF551 domain-containing protein [Klebsiella quasipneumoniae subsp. quasipneumoniae]|uniref:DUF551 domain-containing protein n=1 Tax=Klebsiella quasipneumoniae TaxID=1463165 RepID=UPI003B26FC04